MADTAPAVTEETRAARTIEAEVERRLATAPVPYDPAQRSAARDATPAPVVPTSLLSAARTSGADGESPRVAAVTPAPAAQSPPRPSATVAVAAAPAPVAPKPAAETVPTPAPPSVSEKAPAAADVPAGKAGRTAMRSPGGDAIAPVLTGGWRHPAPVPPAKPWRQREDLPESAISGG